MNGSPVYPVGQEQTGIWFTMSHWAFWPQVPGQGSKHLFLKQALSLGHSGLSTHSGRQASYGLPEYSGIHSQAPSRQSAFGPQGDGLHGSEATGGGVTVKTNNYTLY